MSEPSINFKVIRELANKFSPEQINSCINTQISTDINSCHIDGSTEEVINKLSKASYVSELVSGGMNIKEAVRTLASRIRAIQTNNN